MTSPATTSSKPKPRLSYQNPVEQFKEGIQQAGADLANVPKGILQESTDQMWAAIYGVKPPSEKASTITGSKEQDAKMGYTYLDVEKMRKAQASGNENEIKHVNEKLQERSQEKQENQAAHQANMAAIERAIQELEQKEQQRKQKIAEEEHQQQQDEADKKAANQHHDGDGQAKTKGHLGQARPRAKVETNFEASQGRTGK